MAKRKRRSRKHRRNMPENNPRGRRGHRRGRRRGHRRNPFFGGGAGVMSLGGITSSMTRAFDLETIKTAGWMVAGGLVNSMVRDLLTTKVLPGAVAKPPFDNLIGLATAGLLGAGANQVLPGTGSKVFMGGVLVEVARAYNIYLSDFVKRKISLSGLADWLTQPQVAGALPALLGGMDDYLSPRQVSQAVAAPLGGFLDPYTGVSGMGDVSAIGEEMEAAGAEAD